MHLFHYQASLIHLFINTLQDLFQHLAFLGVQLPSQHRVHSDSAWFFVSSRNSHLFLEADRPGGVAQTETESSPLVSRCCPANHSGIFSFEIEAGIRVGQKVKLVYINWGNPWKKTFREWR